MKVNKGPGSWFGITESEKGRERDERKEALLGGGTKSPSQIRNRESRRWRSQFRTDADDGRNERNKGEGDGVLPAFLTYTAHLSCNLLLNSHPFTFFHSSHSAWSNLRILAIFSWGRCEGPPESGHARGRTTAAATDLASELSIFLPPNDRPRPRNGANKFSVHLGGMADGMGKAK